jgi:fused signal recognition particle receptor
VSSLLNKWREGLSRTRKSTFGKIASVLGVSEITPDTWDDIEALLIQADLGIETSHSIIDELKKRVRAEGLTQAAKLNAALQDALRSRLASPPPIDISAKPTIILIVGVNGSGKTTSIAKLGKRYSDQGVRVLLGAADTYRAAAVDQLEVWAKRLNIPVISGVQGGDPGAVAYDTIQAALSRNTDLVFIDTAGRLHTRYNLMEELKKVHRVVTKALPGAPHQVWLVMDATTGQNALQQARAFKDAVRVSGIILAKLDTSARGGMVFAIQHDLGIPILFAGLGEKPEDLQPFDPDKFISGIMSDSDIL